MIMNNKKISLDYANNLIFDLEKAFWDERGRGARFRMSLVGRDLYESQCKPRIIEKKLEHILQTVHEVLTEHGIVAEVEYHKEDQTIRMTLHSCVHLPVEEKMATFGIEPFACLPANLFVMAIEDQLDQQVEIAEIKSENGQCQLLMVIFNRPISKFQL
jgi:hypothetical protein